LFDAAVETLPGLFAKVADVVRGDDGLDVGRQPAAPRVEIEIFIGAMDFNAVVEQFHQLGPVLHVARAPVNLVNDDAGGFLMLQKARNSSGTAGDFG
jgi:hypothetical protein